MWDTISTLFLTYGLSFLTSVAIFLVGRVVAHWVVEWLRKIMEHAKIEVTLTNFVCNLLYYAALVVVVLTALNNLGIPTTSVIAVLGAATLAVGLALQDSLSNFAAGVMIILFRPFKVGDWLEVAGISGTVESVQIFNTLINTLDNQRVIVPNGHILAGNIVNHSTNPARRIDLVFGIGYGDDLLKAKRILHDILANTPHVLESPAPTVNVLELGDSSVNFAVRPYTHPDNYWTVLFAVTEQVKLRFDAEGITIPFPQRDVHLFQR